MKKLFAIVTLGLASTAFAADYLAVDVGHVNGLHGSKDSTAEYVRGGKSFGDYQIDLQSRTARYYNGDLGNNVEVYTSNKQINLAGIKPFVGVGYDNGLNGANGKAYEYGLVGASYGIQAGPGSALLSAKTRMFSSEGGTRTKQTLAQATYSVPVAKNVSVNFNAKKSFQDIKENEIGLGLALSF